MRDVKHGPRKKTPPEVAVIYAEHCSGCEACIEVCPVDCIAKVPQYPDAPGLQAFCEIDWDRCIGCRLCIRLPRAKSDHYRLSVCPWDAIEMLPLADLVAVVDRLGGPPDYADWHRARRLGAAQRQAERAGGARS